MNNGNSDRVRRWTAPEDLDRIDEQIARNVRYYASRPDNEITERIAELEEEWSMERYLSSNAAALGLTGAVLGLTVSKKWLGLTAIVSGFLLMHAVMGWCPPVPLLRRLGVRTRGEIDREKFALKAIRGDFRDVPLPDHDGHDAESEAFLRAAAVN